MKLKSFQEFCMISEALPADKITHAEFSKIYTKIKSDYKHDPILAATELIRALINKGLNSNEISKITPELLVLKNVATQLYTYA